MSTTETFSLINSTLLSRAAHRSGHLPPGSAVLHGGFRYALLAPAILSAVSKFSGLTVIVWLLLRFWKHRQVRGGGGSESQFVILLLNLFIADWVQATGFSMDFIWFAYGAILGRAPPCYAQAAFIHMGDLSSGFFILSIALHTFYTIMLQRQPPRRFFVTWVVGCWV
ncbi:hypothetical protein LTS18_003837, partial [Coniosporium uncinatum]